MGNKVSKAKQKAAEKSVSEYFTRLGYLVCPLVQESNFHADISVLAEKGLFIVGIKADTGSLDKLYELYFRYVADENDDLLRVNVDGHCITMSTSFDVVQEPGGIFNICTHLKTYKRDRRIYLKLSQIYELLKPTRVLALKGDKKPILFIRYN